MTTANKLDDTKVDDGRANFEAFREKLNTKLKELKGEIELACPVCHRDEWDSVGYVEAISVDWGHNPTGVLKTIPLVCVSCGFVLEFAARVFD